VLDISLNGMKLADDVDLDGLASKVKHHEYHTSSDTPAA
jgi:hypothetical protein